MHSQDPPWFPRFADIPGVRYSTPPGVNVSKLRRRGARPEIHRYEDLPPSLWWGDSSRSPAAEHLLEEARKTPTARVLRNLAEALELPGEPSSYHFAIQAVVALLWSRRSEEPEAFAELERVCWLDLQLVQAWSDAVTYEDHDGQRQFFAVIAFRTLLDLYLAEGALGEAAQVLALADRFGNGEIPAARRARERCAAFVSEDVAP